MARVKIYTDGACSRNPGPGGWAALILFQDKIKKEISGSEAYSTNNRMELTAVIEAVGYVINSSKEKERVDVYSDSAYVVNAVKSSWIKKWEINGWKTIRGDDIKNKDLWLKLIELLELAKDKKHKVNIIKIKGHAGDWCNERVDVLAKSKIPRR